MGNARNFILFIIYVQLSISLSDMELTYQGLRKRIVWENLKRFETLTMHNMIALYYIA